jgi:hypothetical protein
MLVNDSGTLRPSTQTPSICNCSRLFPKNETYAFDIMLCASSFQLLNQLTYSMKFGKNIMHWKARQHRNF